MPRSIIVKIGGDVASSDGAAGSVSLASLGYSNADVDALVSEVTSRSITPETFKFVEYAGGLTDKIYREHYICKSDSNEVERFGINTLFDKSILASTSGAASGGSSSAISSSSKSRTTVSSRFVQAEVDKISHTVSELEVMKEAMDYLFENQSRKTVVIDIFARDNLSIKYLTTGRAEVHSVVLLKGDNIHADGTMDVFVIDPSNSKYSWHLANEEMQKFVSAIHPVKGIVVFPKQLQIYKAEGPTGSRSDESRDCIDAAIKIALGFNKSSDPLSDIGDLSTHSVVVHLSNLKGSDKDYKKIDGHSIRVKQASGVAFVEKFYILQDVIGRKIEALAALCDENSVSPGSDLAELADKRYEDVLKLDIALDYDRYLGEIARFNTDLTGNVNSVLEGLDKLVG